MGWGGLLVLWISLKMKVRVVVGSRVVVGVALRCQAVISLVG